MNYATAEDIAACRALHKRHGTTYYFATRRFPAAIRDDVHALYAFVRIPDELVDNPTPGSSASERLTAFREEFLAGLAGTRPESAGLRAFCDAVRRHEIPVDEALIFLQAMDQDLTINRYDTYQELVGYMRGSASAVGIMLCRIMGVRMDEDLTSQACALGNAMQLTNFLRDVAEDARRGRIYIPLEDLAQFGVEEEDILEARYTNAFRDLMQFEIARTRRLYEQADPGIRRLPPAMQRAVLLARVLYSRILDRIEDLQGNVFVARARTGPAEKALEAFRVSLSPDRVLSRLASEHQS